MKTKIMFITVLLLAIASIFGVVMLANQEVPTTANIVKETELQAEQTGDDIVQDITKKIEQPEEDPQEETPEDEPIVFADESDVPEIMEAGGYAYFYDVVHAIDEDRITTDGFLFEDGEPIQGQLIVLMCSGTPKDAEYTEADGHFTVSGTCKELLAHAETEYEGDVIQTVPVQMPEIKQNEGGSTRDLAFLVAPIDTIDHDNEVPEFSTATLAIAVIVGTLGLVILRRN